MDAQATGLGFAFPLPMQPVPAFPAANPAMQLQMMQQQMALLGGGLPVPFMPGMVPTVMDGPATGVPTGWGGLQDPEQMVAALVEQRQLRLRELRQRAEQVSQDMITTKSEMSKMVSSLQVGLKAAEDAFERIEQPTNIQELLEKQSVDTILASLAKESYNFSTDSLFKNPNASDSDSESEEFSTAAYKLEEEWKK